MAVSPEGLGHLTWMKAATSVATRLITRPVDTQEEVHNASIGSCVGSDGGPSCSWDTIADNTGTGDLLMIQDDMLDLQDAFVWMTSQAFWMILMNCREVKWTNA